MANEPNMTIVGNLTGDPELRYVASGQPVATFTIASTPRSFNKATNQWDDGETMFIRVSCWREQAENVADSLRKGMRTVAVGRLSVHRYTTDKGEERQSIELTADEVGPSLRWARAQVSKAGGQAPAQGGAQAPQAAQGAQGGYGYQAGGYASQNASQGDWRAAQATLGQNDAPPF